MKLVALVLQIGIILVLPSSVINEENGFVTEDEYTLMPTLFHLDNFEQCMSLRDKALYCTATIQLGPEDEHNTSTVWQIIEKVIKIPRSYRHDMLRHGVCVPTSCPGVELKQLNEEEMKNQLSKCFTDKYQPLGLNAVVTELHCETDKPFYEIDDYDRSIAVVFGVLFTVVVLASIYEGRARYKSKEEYEKITGSAVGRFIACFSLPKNWYRLRKSTISNTKTAEACRALNGIRFYNTQLVIITHVAMMCMASPVQNPTFVENITRHPENMLFINGSCAIQTFLLITGFLISYNFLLFFEKRKVFEVRYLVLAFVNRYIRLTPALLLMIAFNSSWLYHMARGPTWDKLVGEEYRNCRKNWWVNLLYVNNYYDVEHMCMQQTWYLAADTQLFVIALVIVGFMWKYQHRIKLILGISLAIAVALPGIVNYYNNFDIVVRQYPEVFYHLFLNVTEWRWMYSSSITNIGGYVLGMIFGYLIYTNQKSNKRVFSNKIYVAFWWLLVWGLPLSVIYYAIFIYQDDYQYTRLGAAVYVTAQRNLFAVGICLLVYGIAENIGWFLRDCILWSPLQVLGKLTYCTFLVHAAVIRIRGGKAIAPTYVSNYWICSQSAGDAVVSYIFGTLLALFVELPVSALQKLMLPQNSDQESVVKAKEPIKNVQNKDTKEAKS